MKNTLPSRIFAHIPEEITEIFRILRAEGFSAEEIGDIFGTALEQKIEIGIMLPQKRY